MTQYSQLLLEQNIDSPHRYFTENFHVSKGDVFVDVGAAEGMISLDVVELASKIYIIECEQTWIEWLLKTFAPYKDKICFINKFASDKNDDKNVTLDDLLKDETAPIFIKLDVEGMEETVLHGAKEVLSRKDTKVAICTYHGPEDAEKFRYKFKSEGYYTEFSKGYMAMVNDKGSAKFRTAMLRAWKK